MTANGKLNLPPYAKDSPSRINDISVFLYSYETGRNFTVAHPREADNDDAHGDLMAQQEGSTVKHINWRWPDCLTGDGQPTDADSDRGIYNVRDNGPRAISGAERGGEDVLGRCSGRKVITLPASAVC